MPNMQRGTSISLPAPVAGLNLRDDIDALKANEARELENWFPDLGQLSIRPGYDAYASAVGSASVQTLVEWAGLTSSVKFIAAGDGSFWDISTAGAAGELGISLTGDVVLLRGGTDSLLLRGGSLNLRLGHTGVASGALNSNRWQWARFNARLLFVNGVDLPVDFDGTTINFTAWSGSGLTISNLVNIANVRNRLWFCEKSSADVWYGSIGGITGSLTKFQLSQIASGGYCMAIGSWSRDAGDGMDDYTVFVMSTGQIIVYQGDPASTFSLIGKYDTGAEPLGRQCLIKVGGELVVITRLGLLPLSAAIGGKALDLKSLDPWGKIAPLVADYAASYGSNDGWSGLLHLGVLYLNVPKTSGALSTQIILNTRTGAWATYEGWNPEVLGVFNNDLFFGSGTGGTVRKVVENTDDNGSQIVAKARGAFVLPSKTGQSFMFTAVRPRLHTQGAVSGNVSVDTDYSSLNYPSFSADLAPASTSTPWGSAWGSSWGSHPKPIDNWYSVKGRGRSVAIKLIAYSTANVVEWLGNDLLLIPGSIK